MWQQTVQTGGGLQGGAKKDNQEGANLNLLLSSVQKFKLLQAPREVCRLSEEPTCQISHKLLPQLKEHKTCNKVKC